MTAAHVLGQMDWPLFAKGVGVVVMAFVLFIGSIYILLSAVFGRRMGYLVLGTAFFGWMIIFASLWTFGFYSQGGGTVNNLGPRGTEAHWQPVGGGFDLVSQNYPQVKDYPGKPWEPATTAQQTSVGPMVTSVQTFLADQANQQNQITVVKEVPARSGGTVTQPEDQVPYLPEQFIVQDVEFTTASDGHTNLAAARGYYSGGGPMFTVFAYHDSGDVPVFSYIFLAVAILGFLIHLPFLDRAERKRKEILTGGTAPVWRGPA